MAKITSNTPEVKYTLHLSAYEASLVMSLLGAVCGNVNTSYLVDTYPIYSALRDVKPAIKCLSITEGSIVLRKLPEDE